MTNIQIYKCPITNYFIEIKIIDEIAIVNYISWDFDNIKAFCSFLRITINKLIDLKIKKIQQVVLRKDWEEILKKNNWEIDEKYNTETYLISCNIEDFLPNFVSAIGIF
ncbi:Hypothetical protein KVN_LOCUS184 [uncultured virus]|nr:Hypothetical protein KVN_LOCUS184 [uncultured virus]